MTKMVTIWQLKTHFLFMTRLLDGDMQLTLISVVPCLLQIAIEKRPKFARMTCDGKMKELIIFCLILSPWWSGLRRRIWSTSPPRTCRLSCTSFHPGRLLQRNAVNIVIVSSFALNLFCPEFVRSCKWNIESGGREGGSSNSWQHFVQNCTIVSKSGERVGFYQNCIKIVSKLYQNCIKFIGNRAVVRQERGGEVRLGETRDNYRFPLNIWQYLILVTIFGSDDNIYSL